jgi:hypothetical protein
VHNNSFVPAGEMTRIEIILVALCLALTVLWLEGDHLGDFHQKLFRFR